MSESFYFKKVKVKGITYLQIWKRVPDEKDVYSIHAGTAQALYDKLVRLENLEKKTNVDLAVSDKVGLTSQTAK